jgi:hypothetical protein
MERKDIITTVSDGGSYEGTELLVSGEELEVLRMAATSLIGQLQPGSGVAELVLRDPPGLSAVHDILAKLEPPIGIYAERRSS